MHEKSYIDPLAPHSIDPKANESRLATGEVRYMSSYLFNIK
jgi:hypothetical protein